MEFAQQTSTYSPEEFMEDFSQSRSTKEWVITPACPSTLPHKNVRSSLGRLDILPLELVHNVLGHLDFQSLARVKQVSHWGNEVVEALPAYKDMMEHAPHALAAMSQTDTLKHHSSALVRRTLRSRECASCGLEFGDFLFMPTCERVCLQCLDRNYAFRMTTPRMAKLWFGLTDAHLDKIPILRSMPEHHDFIWGEDPHHKAYGLVNVKQVKQLALEAHGSMKKVAEVAVPPVGYRKRKPSSTLTWPFRMFENFQNAPLESPKCDFSLQPGKVHYEQDDFSGTASIRFPLVTHAGTDYGKLCKGCDAVSSINLFEGSLPEEVLSELVPDGVDKVRRLCALESRLRPVDALREHIKHCYGVHRLLTGWEEPDLEEEEGEEEEGEEEGEVEEEEEEEVEKEE